MAPHGDAHDEIPVVSFVVVPEDPAHRLAGTNDVQAQAYGYNSFTPYTQPEQLIKYIDPLESELANQVEYDMDEQDREWLDSVNAERKDEQLGPISCEAFEIIIDRLEKEHFDLTKNIPKPEYAMPSEDSTCAICDDSEGENSNAIVFCDGCNLAVHQDCYGVPYIPEGQWLCRKCTVSPETPVQCVLCPNEGGAFKQTVTGGWAHLLCALWIPETEVANRVFMEPITGFESIPKSRWKLKCNACEVREGAYIQCSYKACATAFHATCARRVKLLMPMKSADSDTVMTCFCEKHLPSHHSKTRAAALEKEREQQKNELTVSKSARAYAKTYKPGPPLIPALILDRVLQYISKLKYRKKPDFVQLCCRYWSLKREARRGAPLLKRLYLEPWSATTKQHTDEEKKLKLQFLQFLRDNIMQAKELVALVKDREYAKLEQVSISQRFLSQAMFPHEPELRVAFEDITRMDKSDMFRDPVSKEDVPDYYDVIKTPMCWKSIDSKINKHQYWDLRAFKNDIELVLDNAVLYNKSGTPYHKAAQKIKAALPPIFDSLRKFSTSDEDDQALPIGGFEAPVDVLELLTKGSLIEQDLNLHIFDEPIESLFKTELPMLKAPPAQPDPVDQPEIAPVEPTPVESVKDAEPVPLEASPIIAVDINVEQAEAPAAPQKGKKGKNKGKSRSRPSETARRKAQAEIHALDTSPGFRAPTRPSSPSPMDVDSLPVYNAPMEDPPAPVPVIIHPPTESFDSYLQTPGAGPSNPRSPSPTPTKQPSTPNSRGTKRKRSPAIPITEEPPVIDEVSQRGSFDNFNKGWILTEGSRRHSRVDTPPPRIATPIIRPRPDRRASRLRTPRAEILQHIANDSMDVDIPPPRIIHEPDGGVVIETEDSPAARRQRRRALRGQPVQQSAPPQNDIIMEERADSPLSDLSDDDDDDVPLAVARERNLAQLPIEEDTIAEGLTPRVHEEETPIEETRSEETSVENADPDESSKPLSSTRQTATPSEPPEPKASRGHPDPFALPKGSPLDSGTLVWGKTGAYPYWPGVIYDDEDQELQANIPPKVLKLKKKKAKNKNWQAQLVHYFNEDESRAWDWLSLARLRLLGESRELDDDMLALHSSRQKWEKWGKTLRENCKVAYNIAIEEREDESANGKEEVMNGAET